MKLAIRFPICLAVAACTLSTLVRAEIPQPPVLLLTGQENGTQAQDTFSCAETIHGYVTLPRAFTGKHLLEGIWIGPKGKVVQHSRDEVDFAPPGNRTAALWLQFHPEREGFWNPVAVQQPSDMDHMAYDGDWKIEVRWDEHPIAQSGFKVHCL